MSTNPNSSSGHNKKLGAGYGYLLALLGSVMLLIGSFDLDYGFEDGRTKVRVVSADIPLPLLSLYTSLICTGLGIRFTLPGVVGKILPDSEAVKQLGEKVSKIED